MECRGHPVILVIKEYLLSLNYTTKSVLNFDHLPFFLTCSLSIRTYNTISHVDQSRFLHGFEKAVSEASKNAFR